MRGRKIEIRWLNMDRQKFMGRSQLQAYAERTTGGTWLTKIDEKFKPGILMSYGVKPYTYLEMVKIDKKLRPT